MNTETNCYYTGGFEIIFKWVQILAENEKVGWEEDGEGDLVSNGNSSGPCHPFVSAYPFHCMFGVNCRVSQICVD